MMWQTILVAMIVLAASAFTLTRLVRFFHNPGNKCHGCSGCSLEELKQEIVAKRGGK
jgi:hypothetical protein